jgi:hypothetical protein
MVYPFLFRIYESEKCFYLFRIPSGEMGICDKDPILLSTRSNSSLTLRTI